MKYIKYCNNRKKKYTNTNNNSSSNKYYITTIILYVCLLNIVINNVSLSNEDIIISKQEFQKLLDIKHNVTGLKKISETMFELMFNTNDDDNKKEVIKHTTASNDVSMKENKGLDERTTWGIMSEEELEERRKKALEETKRLFETRDTPPTIDVVKEEKIDLDTIFNISVLLDMGLNGVIKSNMLIKDVLLKMIDDLTSLNKQVKFLKSSQPTSQEIAEIVNKAISSYNEANKKNTKELNKQSMKESNLYQTQMIQMLKDLTNKVGRLESIIISQKKEEEKKQEEENYKVVEAIKPVEVDSSLFDDSILNEAQHIIDEAKTQKLLQGQLQSRQVNAEPITQSQQKLLETKQENSEVSNESSIIMANKYNMADLDLPEVSDPVSEDAQAEQAEQVTEEKFELEKFLVKKKRLMYNNY